MKLVASDVERGYRWYVLFNPLIGIFCGYVDVGDDQRFSDGMEFEDVNRIVSLHGGCTFVSAGGLEFEGGGSVAKGRLVVGCDWGHWGDIEYTRDPMHPMKSAVKLATVVSDMREACISLAASGPCK